MRKSIFIATLLMPHVSIQNTMWAFTSPDGSQVERYIVEFECRVRNITCVEIVSVLMVEVLGKYQEMCHVWRTRPALQSEGVVS